MRRVRCVLGLHVARPRAPPAAAEAPRRAIAHTRLRTHAATPPAPPVNLATSLSRFFPSPLSFPLHRRARNPTSSSTSPNLIPPPPSPPTTSSPASTVADNASSSPAPSFPSHPSLHTARSGLKWKAESMKRRSPPSTVGASPRSPLHRQCVAGGRVPWDGCFSPRLKIHKQQAMAGRWHHGSPMSGIYKTHFVMMAGRQRTAKALRHSGFSISRLGRGHLSTAL
ncbi:unnamed protein product [Urochloa humidicola]